MRPIDHFIAQVDRLVAALNGSGGTGGPDVRLLNQTEREFTALIAPVIGVSSAENLALRIRERIEKNSAASLRKMGYVAAFFLGEYDDASMLLEAEDWQEIRETIEDASEEIDIAALTSLMDRLLSRGLLERR
ncbi:MAG: hypothetical protein LBB98_02070 [Treponema sp.]|jgi:hypothetical protein|nr:hypothetical protein [Treponema sp.]